MNVIITFWYLYTAIWGICRFLRQLRNLHFGIYTITVLHLYIRYIPFISANVCMYLCMNVCVHGPITISSCVCGFSAMHNSSIYTSHLLGGDRPTETKHFLL